jgi:cytochrome b subunit of formate dehydrogenase
MRQKVLLSLLIALIVCLIVTGIVLGVVLTRHTGKTDFLVDAFQYLIIFVQYLFHPLNDIFIISKTSIFVIEIHRYFNAS